MRLALRFNGRQRFGAVEADHLTVDDVAEVVLVDASGDAVLRIPAEAIQSMGPDGATRTQRLRVNAPNHGKPWSDDERAVLRELVASDASMVEMAERLGRSSNGIRSEMRRLGLAA